MAQGPVIGREEVREALDLLYDNPRLAKCALVELFPDIAELENLNDRALRLRAVLLEAVETLRPVRAAPFGSREGRACDVLTLRYVERMSIADMMQELSVGRRQVFRDLSQAEERLAEVLTTWAAAGEPLDEPAPEADTLSGELATLAAQPMEVGLGDVLQEAVEMVDALARRRGTGLRYTGAAGEVVVADRALLKQLLVQLLSLAVQSSSAVDVGLATGDVGSAAVVKIRFSPGGEEQAAGIAEAQRIAAHQGIAVQFSPRVQADGGTAAGEIAVRLRRREPLTLLVIEDNPGAVELYRRYLSGSSWQVRHLADPRLAFEVVRRDRPHVVVLDIMMPRADGWSVLQALRQRPETREVPVLLCSVVEDRELSAVLGATVCLKKPVSQGDFVAALHRCLTGARRGHSPAPRR
ncbi:MAG: response regulator [Anaerolineae bacterium]|nr:response regulator [Anaerolineae bacterium]